MIVYKTTERMSTDPVVDEKTVKKRDKPRNREEACDLIASRLKDVMYNVDLDEVTSKSIRIQLEDKLNMDLSGYKSVIDQEILKVLGQMDAPTEIFDYLYLGTQWNASNFEELKRKGINKILNVTQEIDNFFPGNFQYCNVRVNDEETTELLRYWDKTFRYIQDAKQEGSKVLVHCKMGISRSASVVIAYIMKTMNWSLQESLDYVKSRRKCINPNTGFLQQLEVYQGILHANKQRQYWRSKADLCSQVPTLSPVIPYQQTY